MGKSNIQPSFACALPSIGTFIRAPYWFIDLGVHTRQLSIRTSSEHNVCSPNRMCRHCRWILELNLSMMNIHQPGWAHIADEYWDFIWAPCLFTNQDVHTLQMNIKPSSEHHVYIHLPRMCIHCRWILKLIWIPYQSTNQGMHNCSWILELHMSTMSIH